MSFYIGVCNKLRQPLPTGVVGATHASLLDPMKLHDIGQRHLCFVEKSLEEGGPAPQG